MEEVKIYQNGMEEVKIYQNGTWVKLDVEYVKSLLKKLWDTTREPELNLAIIFAESYVGSQMKQEMAFLKKLIQLGASGYIKPPIRLIDMYKEIQKQTG